MEGGVRGPPSAAHGRHRLREWEVLGLVSQELQRKAELPRTGNPAKVGGAHTVLGNKIGA